MSNAKTAISIDEELFEHVNTLARELHFSRSRVFAEAVEEFIQRHESKRVLEAIDAAYDDFPDSNEHLTQERMLTKHRRLIKGQW